MCSSKSTYIQPVNLGLQFGTELEEIYPPWYLHPTLKNLIYLAETNIRNRHGARFDVEQLLGKGCNGEGSIKQRLNFKKRVINGSNILDIDIAPGIPLWLIRHFLGLLPTPIFPPKCDEHYWYNFSVRYYEGFIESVKRRSADNQLQDAVAFELSHLPARNLTLIFELFEMIRFLSMNSLEDGIVDKHAALLLVKYYTPCLIGRPYRPGNLTKSDKKYFAFILFCVHFWPELRPKIYETIISITKNPNKFHYYPEIHDKYASYWNNNIYLKDMGTQTKDDSVPELFLQIESSSTENSNKNPINKTQNIFKMPEETPVNKIVSSTPKSEEYKEKEILIQNIKSIKIDENCNLIVKSNCKSIKTICTQTDHQKEVAINPKFSVKINSRAKKFSKRNISNDIVILQIPSGLLTNRLKNIKIVTYKRCKEKKSKKIVKTGNIIHNKPNLSPENYNSETYGWHINSTTSNRDFMYDSYIGQPYDQVQTSFGPKQLFSSYKLPNTSKHISSPELPERITQYGWTYNSKLNLSIDPYKLCYDEQKSSNSLNSETPLTEKVKKKKLLMKFSSKLLFFKKFTAQESKKSASCHDLNSTVKYERITKSANSI